MVLSWPDGYSLVTVESQRQDGHPRGSWADGDGLLNFACPENSMKYAEADTPSVYLRGYDDAIEAALLAVRETKL
jgi:hypothetical protein